jgi:hypothetical protein
MAGQVDSGRKVSSTDPPTPQLLDYIDFTYEPLWKDRIFLHQKYVLEGLSIAQIAAQILSSREAVRIGLVEHKIKRRLQGKPGLRPAQLPYGYRLSKGVMVPHLGEQRVVSLIRKMSADRLSYRKICEFLTSVGVPTKNRGQSWHPEMVRRILSSKRIDLSTLHE